MAQNREEDEANNKSMGKMKNTNKGAWTSEEDQKLAQVISIHGPKKWKSIAAKAGLNRCGKSCRLRWMNYLRPNIKRGNISDQEEDLILRLHKLLGNRWSLIAGRLPGRTDNEIKNYWNSHLSKKLNPKEKQIGSLSPSEKSEAAVERVLYTDVAVQTTELENNNNNNEMSQSNSSSKSSSEEENYCNNNNKSSSSNSAKVMMGFNVDEFFDFSNEDPMNLEWISKFIEGNNYDDD